MDEGKLAKNEQEWRRVKKGAHTQTQEIELACENTMADDVVLDTNEDDDGDDDDGDMMQR